jgi:hypothetical protein
MENNTNSANIKNTIEDTIKDSKLLKFQYNGSNRLVEAYSYEGGLLKAYQVKSDSSPEGWRSFRSGKIQSLMLTSQGFSSRLTVATPSTTLSE